MVKYPIIIIILQFKISAFETPWILETGFRDYVCL